MEPGNSPGVDSCFGVVPFESRVTHPRTDAGGGRGEVQSWIPRGNDFAYRGASGRWSAFGEEVSWLCEFNGTLCSLWPPLHSAAALEGVVVVFMGGMDVFAGLRGPIADGDCGSSIGTAVGPTFRRTPSIPIDLCVFCVYFVL